MPAAFSVEPRLPATAEEEAYRHLQQALRLGRYKPGDRLIPEDIAAEIGMSRMPVREAFRRLASDGLVVLRPNRGCVVAGLTVDELYEIFEIRSVLEGLAVRLAMPRIDEEEFEEFDRLLERMERAGQSGGSDWVVRHQEFHGRICALSQRPKLVHQISALHVVIEPYMRIWFDDCDKPLSAREEHAAVIAALRSGDAQHAEQVMQEHVLGTAPLLAELVSPGR
ncbi:GntR family transcriptional regulator [Mesorhizobium sp. M4B.F.Ca.ET.215.01.1.1]|nr:GntR family transcriptional regulator [Mesorhizobium sp. M4B.F.Ca.ET.013.02.1.1]RUW78911.1 GntR family transcriptional regulator [Mesorhizobium sp. M4B.F.Ca.ET.049.02.1.2]RVC83042.1 GntR family transcriptional regulator [Mesorhizobium sp. M4A.F.Ca.ET.022.05.2.1]RVD41457.1 GntR family transcriptional regulator [Mesorhizobium sp. M4A.F.Ca.ET.020.02.1.1]RWC20635.1 MAG: GntR family transcriptional regulator [Mesorhizobium sp.]TGQ09599.1 GntR family transcriptional regulator [Mesorhizobium sp. M